MSAVDAKRTSAALSSAARRAASSTLPVAARLGGGVEGGVELGSAALGCLGEHLAGGRVDDAEGPLGRDQFPCDGHAEVSHAAPLALVARWSGRPIIAPGPARLNRHPPDDVAQPNSLVKKASTVAATRWRKATSSGEAAINAPACVEQGQQQAGRHGRVARHLNPLGPGQGEHLLEQRDARLGVEGPAGLHPEHGRRVGQDPGHGGVGTGLGVGPTAQVQLLAHAHPARPPPSRPTRPAQPRSRPPRPRPPRSSRRSGGRAPRGSRRPVRRSPLARWRRTPSRQRAPGPRPAGRHGSWPFGPPGTPGAGALAVVVISASSSVSPVSPISHLHAGSTHVSVPRTKGGRPHGTDRTRG